MASTARLGGRSRAVHDPAAPQASSLEALADTLAGSPPFDALVPDLLSEVAKATRVERVVAGTTILRQGGPPSTSLYLIRSGLVHVLDNDRLIDEPGPGEVFGELSLLSGAGPSATVVAGEDLECLIVSGDVARRVLGTAGGVAFVQSSLRRGVLRSQDREPSSLVGPIEGATDEEEAISIARQLPELACALVDDGSDAVKIGHVIGSSIDALTRRLLTLAFDDLGQPPVPWAWMSLGSEARSEQALHTDQDHALAYDPGESGVDGIDAYFARLAERATSGLEAAGIPRCNGDAMAITPMLRRSLGSWTDALRSWMSDVGLDGSIVTSVVFDHRRIAGPLDVEPSFQRVISTAPDRFPAFMRHLAHRSLDRKPPTGFMRGFVVEAKGDHAGKLDIKHGGVTIISNLARYFAIRERRSEKGTLERLRGAQDSGDLDRDSREALEEAFRLLWQIRLEHQVRQVRWGVTPDDFVDPAHLGPIQRLGLKEAFRIIGKEQQTLAAELGARY
jgi:signal-transduction protein with cAMP-binding, CBS, and nucleotidyltransferase domain